MKTMSWLAPWALLSLGCAEKADPAEDTGSTDTDTTDTDPSTTDPGEALAILGTWTDSWGAKHEITEARWTQSFPGYSSDHFHIVDFHNGQGWLIAENDADNAFAGGLWSRFDWTWSGEQLFYCQSAFGEASEQEAREVPAADAADLEGGCSGFTWTELLP